MPMQTAQKTFSEVVVMLLKEPALKTLILMVEGSISLIRPNEATSARSMERLFPVFRAPWTVLVLAGALSEIPTNQVPMMEARMPTPAMAIGRRIGPMPPNASAMAPPLSRMM